MSTRPRPVIIVTGDFVRTGGMDMANLALAQFLASQPQVASHVHLVAHRADPELVSQPRVTFHQVPKPLGSYWLAGPMLDRAGRRLAQSLTDSLLIVNGGNCRSPLVSANWVHYVHAAWQPGSMAGNRPALPRRIKNHLAWKTFLRQEGQAFRQAPLLIANSHLTARHLSGFYQVPESKIHVVYYGIDPNNFKQITPEERKAARTGLNILSDRPTAVFVGSLGDSRKGFDILFEAWSNLVAGHGGLHPLLLVVGAGAGLDEYRTRAAHFVESDSIRFLGFRTDVPRVLAASDILVSPSRYEAYGLGVHEALCRGLPILVSRSAGVAERLTSVNSGCTALFTLPEDNMAEGLTAGLSRWLGQPESFRAMAREAGVVLGKQTWPDQMSRLTALLNQ